MGGSCARSYPDSRRRAGRGRNPGEKVGRAWQPQVPGFQCLVGNRAGLAPAGARQVHGEKDKSPASMPHFAAHHRLPPASRAMFCAGDAFGSRGQRSIAVKLPKGSWGQGRFPEEMSSPRRGLDIYSNNLPCPAGDLAFSPSTWRAPAGNRLGVLGNARPPAGARQFHRRVTVSRGGDLPAARRVGADLRSRRWWGF